MSATPENAVVASPRSLASLVEEFTATWGIAWGRVTRRKHADDFARFLDWLGTTGRPATIEALTFPTLAAYVTHLRQRPRIAGVWRGGADAVGLVMARGSHGTLSPNTINAYMRPLRSLAGWLVDEGLLATDPFRRARRAAVRGALLPVEETPAKAATLEDLRTLERGCTGDGPLDLRDRAIVSILITSAARNSSVRLLRVEDVDFERSIIRFRRAKGGKTLEVSLHPDARASLLAYMPTARPALLGEAADIGYLFPALHGAGAPLGMNALSLMLTRRYRAGAAHFPTLAPTGSATAPRP